MNLVKHKEGVPTCLVVYFTLMMMNNLVILVKNDRYEVVGHYE